jgi:serine/threonine protein kinase
MPLTNGQTFAGYTILRLLGSGGMGEVYLAQHPRLPRRDALKLLPHDWSADAEYRARFNREADLASTLWHPHIVGVHDRGEDAGRLWISMDFVDGLDLARVLADRYPAGMPVEEVARIVTAVAGALDYAHKQGLLHRDVKPANIMMTHLDDEGEQRILLTDFGIARNVDDISGITKTNMTVGTVAYCAPEQLLGEEIDGRADQYSLAATAFHLLTGAQLFPHPNPLAVSNRHLNLAPPSLADSRPELAELDPVLAIGLAKRPEDRFKRCSDFARALSDQINPAGASTPATPTEPATVSRDALRVTTLPPKAQPAEKTRKARRLSAIAAAVAVVLTAGLIVIWRPWERPTVSSAPKSLAPSTPVILNPAPATATTAVPPPPPPTAPEYPASAIDSVLAAPAEISRVVGAANLQVKSTQGLSDNSGNVTPFSCVGVIFGSDRSVYADSGFDAIRDQTLEPANYSYNTTGPTEVEQTVAIFPTAQQAQAFLKASQHQWQSCATGQVRYLKPGTDGEGGGTFDLGSVDLRGDVLTVPMISLSNLNGDNACQQALGVRANVVTGARTCLSPNLPANVVNADPNLAGQYAQLLVSDLMTHVHL